MIYYPDTTLPPTESPDTGSKHTHRSRGYKSSPQSGAQGFGEKGESWQRYVGFNGLLWNIVRLNQPNANLMPISQKHRASLVNSTIFIKIPQITQKYLIFSKDWNDLDHASVHTKPRIYATCNTHSRTTPQCSAAQRFSPMYMLRNNKPLVYIYATSQKS